MSIIGVINTKGGVGKTTIAFNLGIALTQKGAKVLLADTDYQTSLSKFVRIREHTGRTPALECRVMEGKIGVSLVAAQTDYDFIVVDAGGRDSLELRQTIAACDTIIIPIRPGIADVIELLTIAGIMAEVEEAIGRPVRANVLINSVKTGNDEQRARDYIRAEFPADIVERFPALKNSIGNRVAFDNALWAGEGVTEANGSSFDIKANSEIINFVQELFNEPFALA